MAKGGLMCCFDQRSLLQGSFVTVSFGCAPCEGVYSTYWEIQERARALSNRKGLAFKLLLSVYYMTFAFGVDGCLPRKMVGNGSCVGCI